MLISAKAYGISQGVLLIGMSEHRRDDGRLRSGWVCSAGYIFTMTDIPQMSTFTYALNG